MMNILDKRHWYDGWIYDRILAPNQKTPFNKIKNLIPKGSTVADIGCGTGRMALTLADKCKSIVAIDLSLKNIETAVKTSQKSKISNIEFIHSDLSSFIKIRKSHFNYAVLSYILHEVDRDERVSILNEVKSIADYIIVSDHEPHTSIVSAIIREILEFGAGPAHYKNYRSYISDGGIYTLARECGLVISKDEIHNSHLHIAVLTK